MTNDDQQLILTCINALGSQIERIEKRLSDIELGVFSDEGILRDSFRALTRYLLSLEERMKIQHDITHSRIDKTRGPEHGDVTGTIRGIDVHLKALAGGMKVLSEEQHGMKTYLLAAASSIANIRAMPSAKQRPQPKRRKGKRPARKNGNA